MSINLTILIENYAPVSLGLYAEHGLSILIEYNDKKYLFDTGQSGNALYNAFELKKEVKDIHSIILSHGHYDHAGGLLQFLKYLNKPTKIFLHSKAFEKKYVINSEFGEKYIGLLQSVDYLKSNYHANFTFLKEFDKIDQGIYSISTVPMTSGFEKIPEVLKVKRDGKFINDDFEDDLSLVLDSDKGLVILLGCAHRGMINICNEVKKRLNKNIYAVIGGTHTKGADDKILTHISEYLLENNVKIFAPNHCTGFDKIAYFKNKLPEIYRDAFCGNEIIL